MTQTELPTRLRLFCAVELSAAARTCALAHVAHLARLRAGAPHVNATWERVEKLHLTLKFLGATAAERVPALLEAAAQAAARVSPCELTLADTGVFPVGRNPRVLWLGVQDPTGQLALLQQRLETTCAAVGFARDARPFHAHVTLARLRTVDAAARTLARQHSLLKFEPVPFPLNELVVMRSDLGPGGSQYTPLSRHLLSN